MEFSESLKKNSDFQSVYAGKRSLANHYLVMYVLENGTGCNRIGISVSKKVGNSVVRHRLKRLVREAYRLHEDLFQRGLDFVVIVRVSAKNLSYQDMEKALLHLAGLQKILLTGRKEDEER